MKANYACERLVDTVTLSHPDWAMHEVLFDDRFLTTLDFVKEMIDEGFNPMTMYFPSIVHGARCWLS